MLDKGFKAHINLAKNEQCLDKEIRSNKKSYFFNFPKALPYLHRIDPVVDLRAVLLDALRRNAVRAADLRVEVRAFAPGA